MNLFENKFGKRGQVAIFVIIALVIVGGIITFFVFRNTLFSQTVPANLRGPYDYYKSCIESETRAAIDLAGSQGGHVFSGVYVPGSDYAPFSSQLNFLGFPVQYWFYISGNGVVKENIPSKTDIQNEISKYVEQNVNANCHFDDFYSKGFFVNLSTPKVTTTINDGDVLVSLQAATVVSKDNESARVTSHSVDVVSNFGKLYNTALNLYSKEKNDAFLENYSADVLRTYAPVDGVELGCSGKVWKTGEVVDGLKNALEANVAAIKFKGNYYTPGRDHNYFVVNLPVDQQVNLLYSKNWPTKIEINGADNELMVASPVGTQEGLGAMGFCYSPYHFVYDISYPVLFQVLDGQEIFQFPVIVVIDKNLPRQGIYSEIPADQPDLDVCKYNTQDATINVYDNQLNKVNANLTYNCFNQKCDIGGTVGGTFTGKIPACVNGFIEARADGYADKKQIFSSNEQSSSDIILDREYSVDVELDNSGKTINQNAIVTFSGATTVSAVLPDVPKIKLSEGFYNVSVYVYSASALSIPGTTDRQCTTVPKSGIVGFFGATEEKCFDINIPDTKIESALVGGGKGEIYLLPSDLSDGKLKLEIGMLSTPKSLDELESNYQLFETLKVGVA